MAIQKRIKSALDKAMSWSESDRGERRRRAGVAVRDDDRKTLEDLFGAFLRTQGRAGMNLSEHTQKTYRRGMHRLLDWAGSRALKPHNIDESSAKNYRAWLESQYAGKTANIYLTGARRFLDSLDWAGLNISNNPFAGLSSRDRIDPKEKADPYTKEELKKLLHVGDVREQAIVLLACDAGLRLAEMTALKWCDVDLERQQLEIIGKGGRRRKPAMTDRLTKTILKLKNISDGKNGDSVIRSKWGKPITFRGIQWLFSDICKRANITARGVHNLRHSCGTRLYEHTRDLQAVARHLGHSTTKTSELYAHLADSDYRAAVAALDDNGIDADDTGE